jgi:hypothetical protein
MQLPRTFVEIIGWFSVILIVAAYALLSFGILQSGSVTYQAMNLVGALGIIYHSVTKKDYQPAVLNVIWALIAIFALLKT